MQLNGAVSQRGAPAVAVHLRCVGGYYRPEPRLAADMLPFPHNLGSATGPTSVNGAEEAPRQVSRNSKLDNGKGLVNWGKGHEAEK